MGKVVFSENLRCVLCDLENPYDLLTEVDRIRLYISEQTKLKLQNDGFYLFINLRAEEYSLAVPVIGIPDPILSDGHEKYYLEDYEQSKVYRESLGEVSLGQYSIGDLLEQINEIIVDTFEGQGDGPEVVRAFCSKVVEPFKKDADFELMVDFFLD